jgi:hypothetical protein
MYREAVFQPGQSVYLYGFSAKAVYGVQHLSRDLETGAVTDPDFVPSLPIADKQQYLDSNSHISWSKGAIHDCVIPRNLTIQDGESLIVFAWRVSQVIRQDLWTRMEFLWVSFSQGRMSMVAKSRTKAGTHSSFAVMIPQDLNSMPARTRDIIIRTAAGNWSRSAISCTFPIEAWVRKRQTG